MFTAGETEHPLTGQPAATLEGVAITHGEVLRAHGDAGVVFEGHRGRRVVGTVVDSLGVGLPNARVYVQGPVFPWSPLPATRPGKRAFSPGG